MPRLLKFFEVCHSHTCKCAGRTMWTVGRGGSANYNSLLHQTYVLASRCPAEYHELHLAFSSGEKERHSLRENPVNVIFLINILLDCPVDMLIKKTIPFCNINSCNTIFGLSQQLSSARSGHHAPSAPRKVVDSGNTSSLQPLILH